MPLSAVYLTPDLWSACLNLAFSTEKEEVIALLIGEIHNHGKNEEVHVSFLMIPQRSDIKKDRVEISDEQLILASEYASNLSEKYGCKLTVVGWYHSHPHITVWPSHVDVNTQAVYQIVAPHFVGIICSVFSEAKISKENEIQMICFQSRKINSDFARVDIPLFIKPNPHPSSNWLETICGLQEILRMEEMDAYSNNQTKELDILSKINNELVLSRKLYHVIETFALPILKTIEQQLAVYKQRSINLENEKKLLMK